MASAAAARRYARALFLLAREVDALAGVRHDLGEILAVFESHPALRNALFRPLHPAAGRKQVLASLVERLGTGALLQNFLVFLIDQRRLIDFASIHAEFERLADDAAGRMRAELRTADPLPDEQIERLRQALVRRSGRDVAVTVRVDESLLGGVVAKVGDLLFDGSLRTQLAQLRASLTKEG